jgi:thioredoxin reductase (NADPH)
MLHQTIKSVLFILPLMCFVACFKKPEHRPKGGQEFLDLNHYNISNALKEENVIPVAIIGSGPAGLSAALYVARAGIKVFVFSGPMPCGQLTQTTFIENWPGREKVMGLDLMADVKKQAESFGATIVHDTITQVDFSSWPFALKTDDGRSFKAMAIVLATGATPKMLQIPGESEYWGRGVTTCAVCDAFFFKQKEVVVCGGGDSAAEMVFELIPYVSKVTVLVRKGAMRAAASVQKKLAAYPNAAIEYHKELSHIYGDGKGVTGIDVYDNQTKTTEHRAIDGVFLAIGHDPNNALVKEVLQLDSQGYIQMRDRTQQTSIPGVFAAGEIQDPYYRQAVIAAGEGVKAALDVTEFLRDVGFSPELAVQLNQNCFESFSDERAELGEIKNYEDLSNLVLNSKGLVVLEFFSEDCPGCIKMLPTLEAVASKLVGKAVFVKADLHTKGVRFKLWHEPPMVQVRRVPAILVFKDGQFQEMTCELFSKRQLMEYLQKFLQ